MKRALVIGGGVGGCAAAHQLQILGGWDVTLVDRADHLGAGVRTLTYGGHPYTFGPRHFLTKNEDVYRYLDEIVPLRSCKEHEFLSYIESERNFFHYPIHVDEIGEMSGSGEIRAELADSAANSLEPVNFEEYWTRNIGHTLYGMFIDSYSKKMWDITSNKEIDYFAWSPKGVPLKTGPLSAFDDSLSAYPIALDGYNRYFDVAAAGSTVLLKTDVRPVNLEARRFSVGGEEMSFDIVINTVSPDALFDECYGQLGYMGRDFHKIVLPIEHCFPENIYFTYYPGEEHFTRAVEYKKFTGYRSPTTLIGIEIPSRNGKFYPLPFSREVAKAQRYFNDLPSGVFTMGRAGSYNYVVDIDDCIEQAMVLADGLSNGTMDRGVVPCAALNRFADAFDRAARGTTPK